MVEKSDEVKKLIGVSTQDTAIAKNLTVTQTAREFGYTDVYHFSRRFKHVLGVAPEFYRKKNNL